MIKALQFLFGLIGRQNSDFDVEIKSGSSSFEAQEGGRVSSFDARVGDCNSLDAQKPSREGSFDTRMGDCNSLDARKPSRDRSFDARAGSERNSLDAQTGSFDAQTGSENKSFDAEALKFAVNKRRGKRKQSADSGEQKNNENDTDICRKSVNILSGREWRS